MGGVNSTVHGSMFPSCSGLYNYMEMDILNDLPELPLVSDDLKRHIKNWVISIVVVMFLLSGIMTFFWMLYILFFEGFKWLL